MVMKKIYICSKYAGNINLNINKALAFAKFAYSKGCLPICVHCFLSKVTGLKEANDREELLKLGQAFVLMADEMWVLLDGEMSEGMKQEMELALKNKIPVRKFVRKGREYEEIK